MTISAVPTSGVKQWLRSIRIPPVFYFLVIIFVGGAALDLIFADGQMVRNQTILTNIFVRSVALGIVAIGTSHERCPEVYSCLQSSCYPLRYYCQVRGAALRPSLPVERSVGPPAANQWRRGHDPEWRVHVVRRQVVSSPVPGCLPANE